MRIASLARCCSAVLHGFPLRVFAPHFVEPPGVGAFSTSIGSVSPSPMPHIADDRLPALVHRDVLDPDGLIASASVALERLYLRRERPGQFVEGALRAISLWDGLHTREPLRERHGRRVNRGHLSRE